MADETPNGQAPAGNEVGQAPAGQDAEKFDAEYVKALRAEAAKYRTEANAAKAKVTQFEQAQLTEAQQLQAQAKAAQEAATAAQVELRQARAEAAIAKAAAGAGVNPALLGRLVMVEFDDAGQPTGVEAALAAVLKEYPQLKPAAQPGMSATNPGRAIKLTLDEVRRMTPDQVNARWDEVQQVLAGK
jgi:hypothetical protein